MSSSLLVVLAALLALVAGGIAVWLVAAFRPNAKSEEELRQIGAARSAPTPRARGWGRPPRINDLGMHRRKVDAGTFHHFHHGWIYEINQRLNGGMLPSGYYAMAEQHAGQAVADVLAP